MQTVHLANGFRLFEYVKVFFQKKVYMAAYAAADTKKIQSFGEARKTLFE
jgi:hypothetical protein